MSKITVCIGDYSKMATYIGKTKKDASMVQYYANMDDLVSVINRYDKMGQEYEIINL